MMISAQGNLPRHRWETSGQRWGSICLLDDHDSEVEMSSAMGQRRGALRFKPAKCKAGKDSGYLRMLLFIQQSGWSRTKSGKGCFFLALLASIQNSSWTTQKQKEAAETGGACSAPRQRCSPRQKTFPQEHTLLWEQTSGAALGYTMKRNTSRATTRFRSVRNQC